MQRLQTPEAKAIGAFIDTLPEEDRIYLLDMVYRVAGVEPPPPPIRHRPPPENVIPLTLVRRASSHS